MRRGGSLFILDHLVDEQIQRGEGAHGRSQRSAEVSDVWDFGVTVFRLTAAAFWWGCGFAWGELFIG
jgi:hypothetical protein